MAWHGMAWYGMAWYGIHGFLNVDHIGQYRCTHCAWKLQWVHEKWNTLLRMRWSMRALGRTSVNHMLRRWAGGTFSAGGYLGLGWWAGIDSAHQGPPICHASIHMGAAGSVGLGGLED